MNSKFKFLTIASLNKKIKTKWFAIINILIIVLVISLVNIDAIISFFGGDFNKETNIIVLDNTDRAFDLYAKTLNDNNDLLSDLKPSRFIIIKSSDNLLDIIASIENDRTVLIVLNTDEENVLTSEIISNTYIDITLMQRLVSAINITKASLALIDSNINLDYLERIYAPVHIERVYLDESKRQSEEHIQSIMSVIFPVLIFPFFMLIIILVQMLGAEINEEKTTRGMEIIISNVSPKTHFLSKILATNLFVLIQGSILFISGLIGIFIRNKFNPLGSGLMPEGFDLNSLWTQLVESGTADRLVYIIPLTLILLALSFIAYSLFAGILASMTTSMEDYQQLQTPIIIISLAGFYLAMLAPIFEGSFFIRFISYVPFLSALVSPALLLIGQIGIYDVFISIFLLILVIYLLSTYGLKIYKVGILNYSTSKLWFKMFKAIKE
jgi:ABC-2 type transport system permease protein